MIDEVAELNSNYDQSDINVTLSVNIPYTAQTDGYALLFAPAGSGFISIALFEDAWVSFSLQANGSYGTTNALFVKKGTKMIFSRQQGNTNGAGFFRGIKPL